MKVVFTGSQDWIDGQVPTAILRRLRPLLPRIAHGKARGFDLIIDGVARALGWPDEQIGQHPANWDAEGRAAGYNRNLDMLRREKPDLVIGAPLPRSKGTWHCLAAADCPRLIFIDGCREQIADFARDCGLPPIGGVVTDWVDEQLRQAAVRGRWMVLDTDRPIIPRRDRPWWVLVQPRSGDHSAAAPLVEALLT